MDRLFVSALEPPHTAAGERAWWFVLRGVEVLVVENGAAADAIPEVGDAADLTVEPLRQNYLGALAGRPCYAVEIAPEAAVPAGLTARALRALYGRVPDEVFALAGRAAQIVEW